LADMATQVELARLATWRAAAAIDTTDRAGVYASMAKLHASETATACTNHAVQIHGGYGFMEELPVARYYRDVKVNEIGEGAGEAPRRGPRWGIGRRRAMVVDATPGGLEVAEALSAVDGFAVDVCESVSVAVERRGSAPADVLVLDPQACGHQASVAMRLWASAYADDPPPVVWCTSALPTPPELRNAVVDGLRAVVVKPLRAQTVADLVVRSCRSHEREVRLRAGGVGVEDLCALLSVETTLRWIQVESELANAHRRPLSVVAVGALTPAVAGTVRRALRPADTLGRRDPRTLLVLLP